MPQLDEMRVRTKLSEGEVEERFGKMLTEKDWAWQTNPERGSIMRTPDGQLLAVYLPGALKDEMDAAYPILTTIRMETDNRGAASGSQRVQVARNQTRAKPVMSAIVGSFEAAGFYKFCRLTRWSAEQMASQWPGLFPLCHATAKLFEEYVPDRYAAQMKQVNQTDPAWVIPQTPFTTLTVNNTWSTGVHVDKGDLNEGFSCISVARRGNYTGARLMFPRYAVAVDMHDGDLLLMNAHEAHGNTPLVCSCGHVQSLGPCETCGAERISVVSYFRTRMVTCGSEAEEQQRAVTYADRINDGEFLNVNAA